jgi:replicative DNA helicase
MVKDAIERYAVARKIKPFIRTGIRSFDIKKGGYLPSEYVILAARTSMGKTTYALQQARNIAHKKYVLYISLEMSKDQVTNKNVAAMTGINENSISLGSYNEEQLGKINKVLGELAELKLFVAEGNRTTHDIRRLIEQQGSATGVDIVFVDYLQRIGDRSAPDQYNRVGNISWELALMTKEFKIPIVALAQLNRESEHRPDKRATLTDLRDSGRIEEDADMVQFLYRASYYKNEVSCNPFEAEVNVFKDRLRGQPGTIILNYKDGLYS